MRGGCLRSGEEIRRVVSSLTGGAAAERVSPGSSPIAAGGSPQRRGWPPDRRLPLQGVAGSRLPLQGVAGGRLPLQGDSWGNAGMAPAKIDHS